VKDLVYDLTTALFSNNEKRHAQEVMKELGINYQHAICIPMVDSWYFFNCTNLPEELPVFLKIKDVSPLNYVGHGLTKEKAEELIKKMKNKETLEEAKLRQLFKNRSNCYADSEDVVQAMDEDCFIETINEWQQEQDKKMYSEEDMKKAFYVGKLNQGRDGDTSFEKFIEQFKKK
jgi:hypothetical protein